MSARLYFLQDLADIINENREKFGPGKNSWYNLLFASVHTFAAQKFMEREKNLNDMFVIYNEDKPISNHVGFVLPSKKEQEGTLKFGLSKKENIERMQIIREQNEKLNEEMSILRDFLVFLYSTPPKSDILQEKYFLQLEEAFEQQWEKQIAFQQAFAKKNKRIATKTGEADKK